MTHPDLQNETLVRDTTGQHWHVVRRELPDGTTPLRLYRCDENGSTGDTKPTELAPWTPEGDEVFELVRRLGE